VRLKVRLALIDHLDYMEANPVFNLFLARADADKRAAADARIREIAADWKAGRTLRLLTANLPGLETHFDLEPEPADRTKAGPLTEFTFSDPPTDAGLPYVDVTVDYHVRPRFGPRPGKAGPTLLAATAWWPVDAPEVKALASRLVAHAHSPHERLLAILRHVGAEVRYGGETGSRYGVLKVIAQGYGHCWDKSDLLVTLCRAAGLPARQVAGWVPALEAGHVWAEVYVEGEGWWPVDATTTWLGISEDYLPLFLTEDGEMPVVHLAWPVIDRMD
jgi:transglutaminase-like putative cysteine protease